tara:strand:- start:573 stop:1427 length:855 start_codon:yes stop_codon:yes gene_type:complete
MKASIRGTEIYYDIAGMQLRPVKNDYVEVPVLFMLHGGPGGDHTRYKQHSLELQDVAQLVFIDHRGCGHSKRTQRKDYTLENNIDDVEALRKHLGLKKICLLGTSYGGMVAQGYAIRYPKNVEKLILVVTAPSYHFLDEAKHNLAIRGTPEQIKICEHLWNGTFKSHRHMMDFFEITESLYSLTSGNNVKKSHRQSRFKLSHDAINEGFNGFLRHFNFIPKLKKISCPTLILAGKDDWICNPNQSKIIADNIPDATLKIFKHCGHALAVDAHDNYIKIIKKFLR